jgi:hypothetical protein
MAKKQNMRQTVHKAMFEPLRAVMPKKGVKMAKVKLPKMKLPKLKVKLP